MYRAKSLYVFGVCGTLALSNVCVAQPPDPRPGPSTPVTVVNTAPIPVAVPGGIAVSGSVTVTNSPTVQSVQSGVWNVGITSPISLVAGATVAAVPAPPQQPYVFHSGDNLSGSVTLAFGPAPKTTRLALTSVIFATQGAVTFFTVYSDDCSGGDKVQYLEPLVPATSTFFASFPSPLVIAPTGSGMWCLNVISGGSPALYPYTLVGYLQ